MAKQGGPLKTVDGSGCSQEFSMACFCGNRTGKSVPEMSEKQAWVSNSAAIDPTDAELRVNEVLRTVTYTILKRKVS